MSDNKELLTIAVIAAALMMVLGTSISSSVLASTSIEAAQPSDDNGNGDTSNSDNGSSGGDGSDDKSNDNSDDTNSNDNSDNASKDDSGNDGNSDDSSGNDDSSDSNNNGGGVPEEYLGEYSTCVSDLSTDDSILSQDDVVDCYGQVFGPSPTHDLGPLAQNSPNTPATTMPGFENMPTSSLQQPAGQQQMQPLGQTQPQDEQQQMQPLGQTQPQDGQQLPIQQQQQQPYPSMGDQHQMSPTELPIDAGILDVDTIKEIVKHRLAQ